MRLAPSGVGEGHHAVGVADVERVAHERHAEGLVQPLEEHLPGFGHAVAIHIAQQGDAVRADPHGGGAFHRAEHGVVEDRPAGAGHGQSLGDQYVAIGQHVDPAGVLETGRKRIDLEPGRRNRRLPLGPPPGGRHLERRDASLRPCRRDHWRAAQSRLMLAALPPHQDRGGPDQRDQSPEDAGQAHRNPSSDRAHASRGQPCWKRGCASLHARQRTPRAFRAFGAGVGAADVIRTRDLSRAGAGINRPISFH